MAVQEPQQFAVAPTRPGENPPDQSQDVVALRPGQLPRGIDGAQHVLRRRTTPVAELERRPAVGPAQKTMATARQADPILLQPVAQARLANPLAPSDLADQQRQVVEAVLVEATEVATHDTRHEHSTRAQREIWG